MTRWLIWIGVVVFWTIALEVPFPPPETIVPGDVETIESYKYFVAKTVHVGVYVLLTVLAGRLPVAPTQRWLLSAFLIAHAWGTEWLQELLRDYCFRGGSLNDLGYDIAGILIGFILTWRSWTRPDS